MYLNNGSDRIRVCFDAVMETKHPRTLPHVTPNTNFSGLSLSRASHILAKVSAKSEMYVVFFLLTTSMSSTYERMFLPTWSLSHPDFRPNRMLIVCVPTNQVSTHTVQKMDTE
jgi:hypothetical protein